jgi:hypothetical protein
MRSPTLGSVVAVLAAVGVSASASLAGISGDAILITATSSAGTASWHAPANWLTQVPGSPDTTGWTSNWATPLELRAPDNTVIARCTSMSVAYQDDPRVNLSFNVTAGAMDTTFTISSAILNFAPDLYRTSGSFQAGMTDNDSNGSSMTGLYGTGNAFHWLCDGMELGQGIPSFVGGIDQSPVSNGTIPMQDIAGAFSMQAEYHFTLSHDDTATGSANYIKTLLVPAPGAASLLALGGGLVARRRRR